ncbi:Pyrrolidone-carboxylate peptidase [Melia azedarach]|uniref:Pyrrolidone-carboxylate peptidase n=1 Tax=Melia azedarach TaxID=155640 RepID=A0ACC1XHU3_MELAZ|nr:Pyrrolidone-carboxylate peptidase [Melia azedarach]
MGSEGPKAVTIHVTGFKKFQGSCSVLETAGDGALQMLYKILESGISGTNTSNEQVLWIHFGVNSGSSKFALEEQAVNEATFRCPDQLGWQPQQLPVVPEDGGTSRIRQTSLPTFEIIKFLKKKGLDVTISQDAGRFVCNYVYYHSLRFAEQKGHKSLFVHVPLFSTIDEETQMQFVATLLEAIASTC